MIGINFLAVLTVAVASMVLGFIWYGPLFHKAWARVIGVDGSMLPPEQAKEMQKKMIPVYVLNFILSIVTAVVLSIFINFTFSFDAVSGIIVALLVWLGFVMPTVAGQAMWSGKPAKLAWTMFFLSAGYQLINFIIAGAILGCWI